MDEALVTADEVKHYLISGEQRLHEHLGWDNDPHLLLLQYTLKHGLRLLMLPEAMVGPPAPFLRQLADTMKRDHEYRHTFMTSFSRTYGIGVVSEGVLSPPLSMAERFQLADQGVYHALDMPGGRHCRTLAMVDLDGRAYQLMRERGKRAEVWDHTDPERGIGGIIPETLRSIALTIATELNANDMLARIRALSFDDTNLETN